jgi:HEAT repeat protein
MPKLKIEEQLSRLDAFKESPADVAVAGLRKALADRMNVIVAKASRITAKRRMAELIPDLLKAFDALLTKPDRDPQCAGKNEIARALVEMSYSGSEPFLRGSVHVQMEPVWGGRVDTAVTLRGACVIGLAQSNDLPRSDVLRRLVAALTDSAHPVRCEAIRALEQMGGEECELLLRLKARLGDVEPQVIGQAIESVLKLEGARALSFAASFLRTALDGAREEAALALGASHVPGALEVLKKALPEAHEEAFRRAILAGIGTSREEGAAEFLFGLLEGDGTSDAEGSLEALALHRHNPDIASRVRKAVEARANRRLQERFEVLFIARRRE